MMCEVDIFLPVGGLNVSSEELGTRESIITFGKVSFFDNKTENSISMKITMKLS